MHTAAPYTDQRTPQIRTDGSDRIKPRRSFAADQAAPAHNTRPAPLRRACPLRQSPALHEHLPAPRLRPARRQWHAPTSSRLRPHTAPTSSPPTSQAIDDERDDHQRQNRRPDIADQILEHRHGVKVPADVLLDQKFLRRSAATRMRQRAGLLTLTPGFAPDSRSATLQSRFRSSREPSTCRSSRSTFRARQNQRLEVRRKTPDDDVAAADEHAFDHVQVAAITSSKRELADDCDERAGAQRLGPRAAPVGPDSAAAAQAPRRRRSRSRAEFDSAPARGRVRRRAPTPICSGSAPCGSAWTRRNEPGHVLGGWRNLWRSSRSCGGENSSRGTSCATGPHRRRRCASKSGSGLEETALNRR